ncbi:N/A [soil metagenome]
MSEIDLHIVSFDIPWPDNYGGVIDVYHKARSLAAAGVKIWMHCFTYGRTPAAELEKICTKVTYYPRDISKSKLINRLPYIVCSRDDESLKRNLLSDESPILFEGLHTTYHLQDKAIASKFCIVRTHNIEHEYYHYLSQAESNLFKRVYFNTEAHKLEVYEKILCQASSIAAISKTDTVYFNRNFSNKAFHLPAFHNADEVGSKLGKGTFSLYHGNLSVAENEKAVLFLIKEVFGGTDLSFTIAGNHPSKHLKSVVKENANILFIENPDHDSMNALIKEAQIHVLPTFQPTGVKLKLLNALYNGRHVLVNPMMVDGTGLAEICKIAESSDDFRMMIPTLMNEDFSATMKQNREEFLQHSFSNKKNAEVLIAKLVSRNT